MTPDERAAIMKMAIPGTWIAFSHDETSVVAQAKSYEEVVAEAEAKGEHDPVISRVPEHP